MENAISIQILNKIPEIKRVCDAVADFNRQHSLSEKIIFTFHLAIDEILTNIISYGYTDQNDHNIDIPYSLEKNQLKLKITDDGNPFDPTQAPKPDLKSDLEHRKIGGLGIYLIKNMMNDIKYSSENGKNTLVLTKKCDYK
ncbi:MAG: ATP-binding protein [Candidatus Marinimicrobia bacterium]|nr:ATP-binding protein [Candidatus Neomarinimicrobiota bacterium]